jgi:ATP-dependent protease ClpP protease subunit
VERDVDRDYYLTAGEAKEYGIIDDVLKPRRGVAAEVLEMAGRLD